MTTLELIERGVGHNCLSDAYDLGREDAKKEINKIMDMDMDVPMDRLSEYVIKHSSCCMPRCEYVENDIEMDCDRCQKIMLDEHDKQIIREFVEWLSNKGYLSFIEYDEDEDFEGNITWDVREECLDVDEVISEWQKGAKNE